MKARTVPDSREFDPSILRGESAIGPDALLVAIGLPGRDLAGEE